MNRALTILTCEYPPFPGGIATYAKEVEDALATGGVAVEVVAPLYEGAVSAGRVTRLLGHHRFGPAALVRTLAFLARAPRRRMVLAADIRTVMIAWLGRLLLGRRYIAMIHGSEVSKMAGRSPVRHLVRLTYAGADRICANSQATLDIFTQAFGVAADAVVTPLGVAGRWFDPPPADFEHSALKSIEPNTVIVSTAGRLEDRKGHDIALEVIQLAQAATGRRIAYVAAGVTIDEAYRERLLQMQAGGVDLYLPGRLSQADLLLLFSRSVAHLLCARQMPDKIEGFGLVILEAAAQACPTICTNVGGIPEAAGVDEGGYILEPDDIDGMAKALIHLIETPDARRHAGEVAQARARRFTWAACAKKTIDGLSISAG